jgi:hypothetical protein
VSVGIQLDDDDRGEAAVIDRGRAAARSLAGGRLLKMRTDERPHE